MAKRMLVDSTHPEETRVVVVNGNRLEELDFETASRKQLKGNIYLARVVRVEPSLQAAFVEYGGNRHGFLAFSEIHPDYYRIPVADREALLRQQQEAAEAEQAIDEDVHDEPLSAPELIEDDSDHVHDAPSGDDAADDRLGAEGVSPLAARFDEESDRAAEDGGDEDQDAVRDDSLSDGDNAEGVLDESDAEGGEAASPFAHSSGRGGRREGRGDGQRRRHGRRRWRERPMAAPREEMAQEEVGVTEDEAFDHEAASDGRSEGRSDEARQTRRTRALKTYKIQEVIKRRQILLVQVAKEERGNKGAALTTYLSLPGRYAVLMPNTPRGGGISRKITNPADRKRLKDMLEDFDIPMGMSVILRTAGIERSKPEIHRDLEYLMRLWDSIRDITMQSVAPTLIYEEANLIKRSIRDLYASDIDEVLVDGADGHRLAKDFMRMLMPSHAKKVLRYDDETIPLFQRFQVEGAIESMFAPVVQLRSGGYIVINQTEALVAIDVNSGRSTKERNIEETALRTNLEAADEVARQLRLRDLAGLIVIDFIDMEDARNNAAVERRLKEAMKADRARIQLGRISPFGLLELSRQRLRPSLQEINFERCPHCQGSGLIRSQESAALAILRVIEEEAIRKRAAEITVTCSSSAALYILNQKRAALADLERRHGLRVFLMADPHLTGADHRVDRLGAYQGSDEVLVESVPAITGPQPLAASGPMAHESASDQAAPDVLPVDQEAETTADGSEGRGGRGSRDRNRDTDSDGRRKRRRRRRRGERGDGSPEALAEGGEDEQDDAADASPEAEGAEDAPALETANIAATDHNDRPGHDDEDENGQRRRRRGRRGGRRRGRGGESLTPALDLEGQSADAPVETTLDAPTDTGDAVSAVSIMDDAAQIEGLDPPPAPETATLTPAKTRKRPTRSRAKAAADDATPASQGQAITLETTAPDADAVTASTVVPIAQEPSEAQAEEAQAKPKRGRPRKTVDAEPPASTSMVEPVAPTTLAEDAPKKTTRTRKKATAAPADVLPAAADVVPVVPVTLDGMSDTATIVLNAVSDATVSDVPSPTEDATIVNPPVDQPKRGWWSRKG
jgi:ribonuclease E